MPTPESVAENSLDKKQYCKCGRVYKPRHCPGCGSTNIYGKSQNSEVIAVGDEVFTLKGFRCRKCLLEFNEGTPCEAPVFESKSMKERRQKEAEGERKEAIIRAAGGRDKLMILLGACADKGVDARKITDSLVAGKNYQEILKEVLSKGVVNNPDTASPPQAAPEPKPEPEPKPQAEPETAISEWLDDKLNLKPIQEPIKPLDKIAPNTEPGGFKETNPMFGEEK